MFFCCRSPHGECGLKYICLNSHCYHLRRSPHGECGLKFPRHPSMNCWAVSLPAWGVWIEIYSAVKNCSFSKSLPAWGVWIEIGCDCRGYSWMYSRSPHGECGLKYGSPWLLDFEKGRSPHGECGLKFCFGVGCVIGHYSRSPHGECGLKFEKLNPHSDRKTVAPRMGSVD